MPASVQIGLLVVGGILLVLALTKGGLKMFNAEVGESAGTGPRVIAGVLGLSFIVAAVALTELRRGTAPESAPVPVPKTEPATPDEPATPAEPRPSRPARTPDPEPAAANGPHLDFGWSALDANAGAQVFQQLPPQAQQSARLLAMTVMNQGEDIFAVEIDVANDGDAVVAFVPEKLMFSLEGTRASVIGINHPRRLKAQRLAPGARLQGLVFVRAQPLLGAALQLGQGELGYGDGTVAVSSNHQ